jgi:hypothetical protein
MTIFDMSFENTTIIDVPEFVPIIGQSLVYLDVGIEGILIAIGGQTEMNGVLLRIVQQTTDVLGKSNTFYGAHDEYQPEIPNPRYHMGVVAGTAPDHTSCNMYVFGGQNEIWHSVRTYLHKFLFDKFGHLVTYLSTVLYG